MSQPVVQKPIDSQPQVTGTQAYPSVPANQQTYQPTATPGQQQQQGAVPMVIYQQAPANYQQTSGQQVYQTAPMAGQQVYQQASVQGRPQVYQQTPANIVQVRPGAEIVQDYTLPQAKAPGILLIIAAFLIAGGFTQIGTTAMGLVIPVVTYGLIGSLCLLAHAENRGRGMVTLILTMSCMSLLVSLDTMVLLCLGISYADRTYMTYRNELIIGYSWFLLIAVLVAIGVSIAMIVITSKKLCRCCGARV